MMIKLGCNYYPEVVELVEEGRIDIDYFKVTSSILMNSFII
ncbi:hypothetical protein GCM10008908_25410 [Clostridium subterminale]|uniref:Uncharacterized protein n=1 Tax=Clostridium subterminale TaxID=1550 RepID=A0ABN1KSG0_CLOSU